MKRFTDAVRQAVAQENWYAALATALTLPDVCAKLESPNEGSKSRYVKWYERFVQEEYTHWIGHNRVKHVFLSGADCYALRCSYLHEGGGNIENQPSREALNRFHFITPPGRGSIIHCNQNGTVLQLQVDIFCNDIAAAVDRWAAAESNNAEIQMRIGGLLAVHSGSAQPSA